MGSRYGSESQDRRTITRRQPQQADADDGFAGFERHAEAAGILRARESPVELADRFFATADPPFVIERDHDARQFFRLAPGRMFVAADPEM